MIPFILAAVIVGILLVMISAGQAEVFEITRRIQMRAAPETVFPLVNTLRQWELWSPWAKLDPNMKTTYEGAPSGVGASYSWVGNSKVGEGRLVIVESVPSERVGIQLEFLKPMVANNRAEFTFRPDGGQTWVTWTMTGKRNCMSKTMGMIFNFDQMIGREFDNGLVNMKTVAEKGAGTV